MNYRTFVTYNIVGAVLWGVGVTTLGYFLGQIDVVKENIEIAIVAIIALVADAGGHRVLRHHRRAAEAGRAASAIGRAPRADQ